MSKRLRLNLIQQATSSFFHLTWKQLLAFIVILFTLHSPGSSGWPGCVLEHSKHQTQMGTKSHYFSAGCIMAQVVGETSTFPHYDWVGIKKPSGNLIAELMGSWPTTVVNDLKLCSLLPTAGRSASFLTTNRLLRIHRAMARQYAEQQNCFSL